MGPVLGVIGALLILLSLVDAVATTTTTGRGGGPLTHRVGKLMWRVLLPRRGHDPGRLLPLAGPLVMLTTVLLWVVLHWLGWTLLFSADVSAVQDAQTGEPASFVTRLYYAGYVVFTLGVGDYTAGSPTWQVLTAAASFVGLFIATLSITYLVSVVSAAVSRRKLALSISLLGDRGADVVTLHWHDGQLSSMLSSRLMSLQSDVLQTTQQHLAYPVLHYFYGSDDHASMPVSLAALDDAYVLMDAALVPEARPEPALLVPLRRTLEHYTNVVMATSGNDAGPPPLPDLEPLRAAGIPVVDSHAYRAAAQAHTARRKALHQLVQSDARAWPTS